MDPLITLELTFAKTDISEALRMMRIAQMHRGKPSFLAGEIKLLERALGHLDRVDAMSATASGRQFWKEDNPAEIPAAAE